MAWTSAFVLFVCLIQVGAAGEDDPRVVAKSIISEVHDSDNYAALIDQHRKGTFSIRFVDQLGNSITKMERVTLALSKHDFRFGTATQMESITDPKDKEFYEKTILDLFPTAMTPANIFKWTNYEPAQGQYRTQQAIVDKDYIQWGNSKGIEWVRGHALEWLSTDGNRTQHFSRVGGCAAYVAALKARVQRDVGHFKGRIQEYDVWNEPLHCNYLIKQCGLWNTTFQDVFRWAHEADPDARLCLNDYSVIEDYGGSTDAYVTLIKQLLTAGVPVHCIGIQSHLDTRRAPLLTVKGVRANLDKLAALGLPLVITEFSLRTGAGPGPAPATLPTPKSLDPPADQATQYAIRQQTAAATQLVSDLTDVQQAQQMAQWISLYFSHPAVDSLILWGFWDRIMWIKNGGVYRSDKSPKLAAAVIKALWQDVWSTNIDARALDLWDGVFAFDGFYGQYKYSVTGNKALYEGTLEFKRGGDGKAVVTLEKPRG